MTDAAVADPKINIPEWSVSELSAALKRTVEDEFAHVRVRGEVSGYRGPHSSGHCYFALKDEGAKIDAVVWRTAFARMKFKPEEGMEVIATGRLTTYPGRSSYQIVIERLEPAGVGALMALLEQRKQKLAAEGLFDEARKQLLPYLPEVIGVVTSPTGAVIRDILHRLSDRFPRHVMVWPVRVQGEGAAEEIAAAIRGFNALPEQGRLRRPSWARCQQASARRALFIRSAIRSARTGTAISAAAVGVGARRSEAKSISVMSVSWPTAEISGIMLSAAARTTISSLNDQRSSSEPPPRATMMRSGLAMRPRSGSALKPSIAAATCSADPSP